jgi:hypothetical protein
LSAGEEITWRMRCGSFHEPKSFSGNLFLTNLNAIFLTHRPGGFRELVRIPLADVESVSILERESRASQFRTLVSIESRNGEAHLFVTPDPAARMRDLRVRLGLDSD